MFISSCNAEQVLRTLPEGKFDKNYKPTNFREIEQESNASRENNKYLSEEKRYLH